MMPVLAGGSPVGLLTVNSTKKNGLSMEGVVPMRLVAELCVTPIAANQGKCPPLGTYL